MNDPGRWAAPFVMMRLTKIQRIVDSTKESRFSGNIEISGVWRESIAVPGTISTILTS